jgi:hypothetical protein
MMAIYNDCEVKINLNELVQARAFFQKHELTDEQIDHIASALRERMTFDSLFEQTDMMIWEFLDVQHPDRPNYGEIQPEPGREAYLTQIEKNKKQFEMVDLVSPAWTIKIPRRKK